MQIDDHLASDYATFEHLLPRSMCADHYERGRVQMLACERCNNKKKNKVASDELIATAAEIFREYQIVWGKITRAQRENIEQSRAA